MTYEPYNVYKYTKKISNNCLENSFKKNILNIVIQRAMVIKNKYVLNISVFVYKF